jgi:multicomponent Na+:H+ antiporter subunit A
VRRSIVVDTTARLISQTAMVLSLYLLFAGHNQPGGGFVGGLVAGAALAVHYVAGGIDDVRAVLRIRPWIVLGSGLVLAAGTALAPVVLGAAVLEGNLTTVTVPALGTAKITTALAFDAGVYAVMVGLAAMIFEGFGEPPAREAGRS